MLRVVGGLLLLVSVAAIFLIVLRYPFTGIIEFQLQEWWLWLVLALAVLMAGLGGYLLFRQRRYI